MTFDNYGGTAADTIFSPSGRLYAIVPHNTNALPEIPKAIYVGTGGDIVLRGFGSDADVTLKNVAAGSILDVRPSHVRVTGTTATDLVALA